MISYNLNTVVTVAMFSYEVLEEDILVSAKNGLVLICSLVNIHYNLILQLHTKCTVKYVNNAAHVALTCLCV